MKKIATTAALALAATALVAAPAQAAPEAQKGNKSLADVLTSDGNQFDSNSKDFDLVTEAVLAVIEAKPDTPLALIADGKQKLTVFAPDDRAFRRLGQALTGQTVKNEEALFGALVEAAGVDLIEQVLLYHVIPGETVDAATFLKSDGDKFQTALGKKKIKVDINNKMTKVSLIDKDPDTVNAKVTTADVNKGNKQIAHGIDYVLLPKNF